MPRCSIIQFPSPHFSPADKKQFYVCECQLMTEKALWCCECTLCLSFLGPVFRRRPYSNRHFCRKRCLNSVSIHGLMEIGHGNLPMCFLMDHVRNRCAANWQIYCWHKEVLLMKTNIRKLHINLIAVPKTGVLGIVITNVTRDFVSKVWKFNEKYFFEYFFKTNVKKTE